MGLLMAALSGGAKGYDSHLDSEIKRKNEVSVAEQRAQIEEAMRMRMEQRVKDERVTTAKSIDARTDELTAEEYANRVNAKHGSQATGKDAEGLLTNAGARKAYGIEDISEIERLRLRGRAAGEVGALDQQKEINAEMRTEQSIIKSDQQFEAQMMRLDKQIAQAGAAAARADKHNTDANTRAQSQALQERAAARTPELKAALKAVEEAIDPKEKAAAQAEVLAIQQEQAKYLDMSLEITGVKMPEDDKVISAQDFLAVPPPKSAPAPEKVVASAKPVGESSKDRFQKLSGAAQDAFYKQYRNAVDSGRADGKNLYDWWASQ